jgi:5'-methylthioinosine phosphorylase
MDSRRTTASWRCWLCVGVLLSAASGWAQPPTPPAPKSGEKVKLAIINRDRQWLNLESAATLEDTFTVDTPLGKSPTIRKLRYKGVPFYYLTRLGDEGSGEIASLAEERYPGERTVQVWVALMQLGVEDVLHGNLIGGVNPTLNYDDVMIVDDFIDLKPNHPQSVLPFFYKKEELSFGRLSTRMNPVLCPELRRALYDQALKHHYAKVYYGGTLVQTRTGRWETPAEIRMIQKIGGDLVATQDGTYIVYARQAGIHFATLQYVMNFAEGLRPSDTPTTSPTGFARMAESMRTILLETVASLKDFTHHDRCFPNDRAQDSSGALSSGKK